MGSGLLWQAVVRLRGFPAFCVPPTLRLNSPWNPVCLCTRADSTSLLPCSNSFSGNLPLHLRAPVGPHDEPAGVLHYLQAVGGVGWDGLGWGTVGWGGLGHVEWTGGQLWGGEEAAFTSSSACLRGLPAFCVEFTPEVRILRASVLMHSTETSWSEEPTNQRTPSTERLAQTCWAVLLTGHRG